jgi:putative aminopeptidase FrvX
MIGVINPGQKFKVIIEAHADEIGWYVHTISSNGFVHVEDTGGSDASIALGQRVKIHTANGHVDGVFGWPAVHTRMKNPPPNPAPNNLFIDCGCTSREEVEKLGIQIGDYVTFNTNFFVLNKNYFVGRTLDNRMGGFVIARVARMLRENNIQLPYTLYLVNSTQEEVGTKGAEMVAKMLSPKCAIVIDVTHDTSSPLMNKDMEGDITIGKGPVIMKSAPIHNKLRQLLMNTAKEQNMPFQLSVMSGSTGTDADAFAYAEGGIPSCLVSLPLRYMHTTVETMHKNDIENAAYLIYHTLQKLTPDFNFNYVEDQEIAKTKSNSNHV